MSAYPALLTSGTLLTGTGVLTGQGSRPILRVYVSFDADISKNTIWSEVTKYVRQVSYTRGRVQELNNFDTGTATVVLDDNGGQFDPDNTGSPYYPYVTPSRRVWIAAEWDGATYNLFTGYAENWSPIPNEAGLDRTTVLGVVDVFKLLSLNKPVLSLGTQPVPDRIASLFSAAITGAAFTTHTPRNLGVFTSATNLTGTTSQLTAMQQAATDGGGFLYCDEMGNVRYDASDYRTTHETSARITFDTSGGVPYRDPQPAATDSRLFTQVTVSTADGATQTAPATTTAQETQYGQRTLNVSSQLYADVNATGDWTAFSDDHTGAATLASTLQARYQDAKTWIGELKFLPDAAPSVWPAALGMPLGGYVTVTDRPAYLGGGSKTNGCYVEQIDATITPENGGWEYKYTLSPSQTATPVTSLAAPVPLSSAAYTYGLIGNGDATTVTSSTFTPTTGALIVVAFSAESMFYNNAPVVTDTLGGLSWSRVFSFSSNDNVASGFAYAVAPASPRAGAVTLTIPVGGILGAARSFYAYVFEVWNAHAGSPVGATGTSTSGSVTLSGAPASTSTVLTMLCDASTGTLTLTPPSGFTTLINYQDPSVTGNSWALAMKRGSAPQTMTWSESSSIGGPYYPAVTAIEIKY